MPGEGAPRKKGADGEAEATGRNPTDRGKSGTKRHLLTEGRGVPTALLISGANRTDMKKLADLLDAVVIERPPHVDADAAEEHLCLDRGYDDDACREAATARGYAVHIPPKPAPPSRRWPDPAPRHAATLLYHKMLRPRRGRRNVRR